MNVAPIVTPVPPAPHKSNKENNNNNIVAVNHQPLKKVNSNPNLLQK